MILLDSNAFIWILYEPERLGLEVLQAIEKDGDINVSVVTLWELAVKYAAGKLPYSPQSLAHGRESLGAELLQLTVRHIAALEKIQLPQKDPFDRMLVAQAHTEAALFVTSDKNILTSDYRTMDVRR